MCKIVRGATMHYVRGGVGEGDLYNKSKYIRLKEVVEST